MSSRKKREMRIISLKKGEALSAVQLRKLGEEGFALADIWRLENSIAPYRGGWCLAFVKENEQ